MTPAGRRAAEDVAAKMSNRCQQATSVGVDWTGFQINMTVTCSQAEMGELIESLENGSAAADLSAAGLAPAGPREAPALNAGPVISEDWNCILSLGQVFTGFLTAAALMLVPWLGWLWFTVIWSGWFVGFVSLVTTAINNCTHIMQVYVEREVWVSYELPSLPVAAVGLSGLLINPKPGGDEPPDAYWVRSKTYCAFQYYYNWKWSMFGYYVPASVRYGGCG